MVSFANIDELHGNSRVDIGVLIAGGEVDRDDIFAATVQLDIVADAVHGWFAAIKDMGFGFADGFVILPAPGLEGDKGDEEKT